jgi:hypothetical protein
MVLVPTGGVRVLMAGARKAIAHRAGVDAVDKLSSPAITSASDQTGATGVMANTEHKVAYAAGNSLGTAGTSAIGAVTPTLNKTVDLVFAKVEGAEFYDIFFSTDAQPLWVGRITEAERVAGCSITAVGTVGEAGPGGEGNVNIRLVGTGVATNAAPFAYNNAYYPDNPDIDPVDCSGAITAYINVALSVDDFRSLPTLKILPFTSDGMSWFAGTLVDFAPGSAAVKPMPCTTSVSVAGVKYLVVCVDTISGQNAEADITVELS